MQDSGTENTPFGEFCSKLLNQDCWFFTVKTFYRNTLPLAELSLGKGTPV